MSLAGKFGNFEIKKTDRISKEDQEWLSRREKMYKRALMIQKSVYDIYKSEDETYTEEDRKEFSSFTVSDLEFLNELARFRILISVEFSLIFQESIMWS